MGMTLAVFVFPNATGHVIDKIIPDPRRHDEFALWIGIALLGFLTKDGLNSLRIFINNTFEQKVIFDIRSDLYAKIQRLPLRWFDSRRTGDIMTRVVEDVTNMERVLIDGVEQGLIAALQVLRDRDLSVFPAIRRWRRGRPCRCRFWRWARGFTRPAGATATATSATRPPTSTPCCTTTSPACAKSRPTPRKPPSTRASTGFPTNCGAPRCG